MIEKSTMTGTAIATAAAAMLLTGCQSNPGSGVFQSADSSTAAVKCYGSNACKGQGACKTAMNACKGHSFVMMTEKACMEHFGRA